MEFFNLSLFFFAHVKLGLVLCVVRAASVQTLWEIMSILITWSVRNLLYFLNNNSTEIAEIGWVKVEAHMSLMLMIVTCLLLPRSVESMKRYWELSQWISELQYQLPLSHNNRVIVIDALPASLYTRSPWMNLMVNVISSPVVLRHDKWSFKLFICFCFFWLD